MTTPSETLIRRLEDAEVGSLIERLEDLALGYECAAHIERGVMEHLRPEVEAWRGGYHSPLRMRLVRENASSVGNERSSRQNAETLRSAIALLKALEPQPTQKEPTDG